MNEDFYEDPDSISDDDYDDDDWDYEDQGVNLIKKQTTAGRHGLQVPRFIKQTR